MVGHLAASNTRAIPNTTTPTRCEDISIPPSVNTGIAGLEPELVIVLSLRLNTLSHRTTDKNMSESENSYDCPMWPCRVLTHITMT